LTISSLCAATERGTLRIRRCAATHARPTLARWRGDRGHRLGRTQQCCFYEEGVAVDRWERLRGGAFGFGLYKVRNAYASSSTTTSRAMRATCSGSARSPRAARLASSATQRAAARGIRAPTGPLVPRCVLPPDTHPVHPRRGQGRALGIPISGPHAVNLVNRWWQFHDTQLSSWVDAAFQALAIDEERSSFGPTPWTSDPRADQHVEQVWFAGVHSDVGGGYPDPALAEIALLWMADRARECGLVLQADAFPASPENATQAPQDRMTLCRSQPAGNAAPIPHGLLPPAFATDPAARREGPRPRVRRRHRRRPAPSRPAVRSRRVDRIPRGRRPVIPVAPARHRVLPAPPPRGANETGSTSPRSCGLKRVLEE
jgi:T6SS, Phospholipase effector Tle1-like, catalytic domain